MVEAVKDKIIVEVLRRSMTGGGIIAPTSAVIDPQGYGKVISIGEDVIKIKVDDILFFHLNGGMDVVINNKILKVLKYDEVYGKVTDKNLISQLDSMELISKEGTVQLTSQGGIIQGAQ